MCICVQRKRKKTGAFCLCAARVEGVSNIISTNARVVLVVAAMIQDEGARARARSHEGGIETLVNSKSISTFAFGFT